MPKPVSLSVPQASPGCSLRPVTQGSQTPELQVTALVLKPGGADFSQDSCGLGSKAAAKEPSARRVGGGDLGSP